MRSEECYVNGKSTDTSWDRTSDLPICSTALYNDNYKIRPYSKELNFSIAAINHVIPRNKKRFAANTVLFVSDTENRSSFVQPEGSSLFEKSRLFTMRFQPMSSH